MSGAEVRRLRPAAALPVTPALLARTPGARLQLMCRLCMVPRELDPRHPRLRRWWTTDLEQVFARATFRCRCGAHAHALRATRPTRDGSETLLLVSGRRSING